MHKFYAKKAVFSVYQVIVFVLVVLICLFAVGIDSLSPISAIWLVCVFLIGLAGLFRGLMMGLGLCLLFLFSYGTYLMWQGFVSGVERFSIWEMMVWMVAFPTAAIVTGLTHKWVTVVWEENKEMREKFDELVTIDEETGLDNLSRFLLHMEEEFKRSQRFGFPFALLLIKVKYLDQFEKLYGKKESKHLLRSIAEWLQHNLRTTDRKFRISGDTFAVILFNTEERNVGVVVRKLERLLKYHRLKNAKKEVTLTIAFGEAHYKPEMTHYVEMIKLAQNDLDHFVQ